MPRLYRIDETAAKIEEKCFFFELMTVSGVAVNIDTDAIELQGSSCVTVCWSVLPVLVSIARVVGPISGVSVSERIVASVPTIVIGIGMDWGEVTVIVGPRVSINSCIGISRTNHNQSQYNSGTNKSVFHLILQSIIFLRVNSFGHSLFRQA